MEHYAFSGSQVLIDQATRDFSPGDLPAETVIEVETNHQGGKFYKFT
jgi:helix-turn-helix protein